VSSLTEFLDFLWEDTNAYVNLSIKSDDGSWRRSFAEWPRQRNAVKDFISKETAEGNEVFVSPSMWRSKPPAGQQYGKELFLGSHVLWAEFDGNAPEIWDVSYNNDLSVKLSEAGTVGPAAGDRPSAGQPEAATATSRPTSRPPGQPDTHPLPPSWINTTSLSQHQHVYWKLDSLLTDPDILENLNRTIASELGADNCWDATRVLRPPETTNYGIGKPDREGKTYPVRVEETNPRRYPIQNFRQTASFRPAIRSAMDDIPDIREVLALHSWDADFYKAFTEDPPYKKRSDVLQFLAFSAAESGFTNEEIYAVIRDADDRWQKYTGRLDREKWLLDHVDRARTKYPLGVETLTFEGLLGTRKTEGTESSTEEVPNQLVFTLAEFMAVDAKIEWMINGLLPKAGYGIIAGQNGIGKSQLGIRLCEAVAEGTDFLLDKWTSKTPGKAMFLSLEMEFAELQEFYRTMLEYGPLFENSGDRYLTVPIGSAIALDKPDGLKFLEDKLTSFRPDLLVIDSLSVAMSGNFRDDTPVLEFNKVMKRIRSKFGVAVVVIHHNRKGQDKKFRYNELDDLYGSRFLPQDTAFVLMVDKPKTLPGDTISVNQAKIRFAKAGGEVHVEHTNMNFTGGREIDDPNNLVPMKLENTTKPTHTTKKQEPKKDEGFL
jgi:archaellum biogenesis ATPase FlaH